MSSDLRAVLVEEVQSRKLRLPEYEAVNGVCTQFFKNPRECVESYSVEYITLTTGEWLTVFAWEQGEDGELVRPIFQSCYWQPDEMPPAAPPLASPAEVVSVAGSVISGLGALTTALFAFLKEKREARRERLDLEKLRLENEKLRAELEKKKKPARRPFKPPS